jgi:hypothetical protein
MRAVDRYRMVSILQAPKFARLKPPLQCGIVRISVSVAELVRQHLSAEVGPDPRHLRCRCGGCKPLRTVAVFSDESSVMA